MAKKIYLTQEQVDNLRKYMVEGNEPMEYPVDIEPGENPVTKLDAAKNDVTQATSPQVANDTKFVLKGEQLEGKRFSKKQIEEAKIQTLHNSGKKYTKSEFSKTILRNG